ncbi:hypothetical protein EV126DRAFT_409029 [Verticillium dahliae]|nr:hypothetical protein EV126DRAFT_409029 [Verticillium dahliae]
MLNWAFSPPTFHITTWDLQSQERNLRSPSAPEWLHMRPAAGPETLAFLVAEVSTWWEAPSKISLNVELEGGSHLRAGISGLAISLRRLPLL